MLKLGCHAVLFGERIKTETIYLRIWPKPDSPDLRQVTVFSETASRYLPMRRKSRVSCSRLS
jgi:hypothetical protein